MGATFVPRTERGAGIPGVERLAYFAEMAAAQLEGVRHLVLVDVGSPVSFFAYPGKPSDLVPEGCCVHVLAGPGEDSAGALAHLADLVGAEPSSAPPTPLPDIAPGALTNRSIAAAVAAALPAEAIVSDEGDRQRRGGGGDRGCAAPRLPAVDGWSDRPGVAAGHGGRGGVSRSARVRLEADGSAMYTIQALWTQAREQLDVTTVIFNNRSYAILSIELARTGAGEGGPKARDLFDLSRPDIDFVTDRRGDGRTRGGGVDHRGVDCGTHPGRGRTRTAPDRCAGVPMSVTAPPSFDTIIVAVDGPTGSLTLSQPERLNPLSSHTLHEIESAARWFDTHDELKVVVVSGQGRAFSAGADVSAFGDRADGPVSPRDDADSGWRMARAMDEMRAVTVARIQGWCVGGGLVLAAGCDLRVAASTARFSIPEVELGIPLAWGGIPRLVRGSARR